MGCSRQRFSPWTGWDRDEMHTREIRTGRLVEWIRIGNPAEIGWAIPRNCSLSNLPGDWTEFSCYFFCKLIEHDQMNCVRHQDKLWGVVPSAYCPTTPPHCHVHPRKHTTYTKFNRENRQPLHYSLCNGIALPLLDLFHREDYIIRKMHLWQSQTDRVLWYDALSSPHFHPHINLSHVKHCRAETN